MGEGAVIAAAAAAKQRRLQGIVDAFRLGDATSPDRARPFESLGIARLDEAEELLSQGVLLPGPREGTYYLSEAGYIVKRDRRSTKSNVVIAAAVMLLLGLMLVVFVTRAT